MLRITTRSSFKNHIFNVLVSICFSLDNLRNRGTREEGILRVAGNKQKTELLYNELEQSFYSKNDKVDGILRKAGVHDLSALLKRWLRELPTPLLANDLLHLFYQTVGKCVSVNEI